MVGAHTLIKNGYKVHLQWNSHDDLKVFLWVGTSNIHKIHGHLTTSALRAFFKPENKNLPLQEITCKLHKNSANNLLYGLESLANLKK